MKNLKLVIFSILILFSLAGSSSSQDTLTSARKFSIGISFFNINSNWIYVNDYLYIQHDRNFRVNLIPSVFIRLPEDQYSFRFRFEFNSYKYSDIYMPGMEMQQIDGTLNEGRILIGIEKYLILKKLKIYPFLESGVSLSDFKGSYFVGYIPVMVNLPFKSRSFGICIQGGVGLRLQIFKNINLVIESCASLGKEFFSNYDLTPDPENRFILRPVNLMGLDYAF